MTNEELCLRYQAGDTDAAEELVSRNKGFIRSIALGSIRMISGTLV